MSGQFKAGSFDFPTSVGSLAIVLGFEPQGVIFFGGNQSAEDTVLTNPANPPGVFFGMAWRSWQTGLVDYQSQSNAGRVSPASYGVRWRARPITMISSGTTLEYEASACAFDPTGFTLTISTAAPGVRPIHYLAWGGFDESRGASISKGVATDHDFALDARAFSGLMFSMFSSGNTRDGQNGSAIYFTMGTSNFPEDAVGSTDNGMAITFRGQTSTAEGWTQRYANFFSDSIMATVASGPVGTWQTNIDHLRPFPAYTSQALRASLFGNPNRAQIAWWSAEGANIDVTSPDTVGGINTYTAAPNVPGVDAALFFGTTGYGSESQLGVNVAYVYGVLTPDYQGVVAFDTGRGDAPADGAAHFFQSRELCYAECLRTGAIRASSGELVGNDVKLTAVLDGPGAPSKAGFVQVWGTRPSGVWVPHIYRRD